MNVGGLLLPLAYGLGDLFLRPLPLWDHWWILILPLCLGVAIVYKAVRLDDMRHVPRQAIAIFLWILGGMVAAAVILLLVVKLVGS